MTQIKISTSASLTLQRPLIVSIKNFSYPYQKIKVIRIIANLYWWQTLYVEVGDFSTEKIELKEGVRQGLHYTPSCSTDIQRKSSEKHNTKKISKEQIFFLRCANASGFHKLKLLVVGLLNQELLQFRTFQYAKKRLGDKRLILRMVSHGVCTSS